jgi:hypothetical protein
MRTVATIDARPTLTAPIEYSEHHLPVHSVQKLPITRSQSALAIANPVTSVRSTAQMRVIHSPASNRVSGRVILMEGPLTEPAGLDATLVLCQVLWLGLFLALPLLVVRVVAATLIAVPSLLVLLAIAWVLGLISPSHLLQAISLVFRMGQWGRSGGETIPVRYLRVRGLRDDGESIVRLPGHLGAANVGADDVVTFRGKRRNGVLHARHGWNHRTHSAIRIRSRRSFWLLIITLIIYSVIGATLAGMANGLHWEKWR